MKKSKEIQELKQRVEKLERIFVDRVCVETEELPNNQWYISNKGFSKGCLVYKTSYNDGYGINSDEAWCNEKESNNWSFWLVDDWRPATESEVREMLIKEAKKRGLTPDFKIKDGHWTLSGDGYRYIAQDNSLWTQNECIFKNGEWIESKSPIKKVRDYAKEQGLKAVIVFE